MDDYDGVDAFISYVANRVRNPAGFYRKLRQTGQKNKMKIFRNTLKTQKRFSAEGRKRSQWSKNAQRYHWDEK